MTAAMVELCRAYTRERGTLTPVEVARRHEGVPGLGWLLPVALVHDDQAGVLTGALEVATAAGVPVTDVAACVSYVMLAWELFRGCPVEAAVAAATDEELSPAQPEPVLCGMALVDGLNAGIWALGQPGTLSDVVASLAELTEPWVAAAATGLLGVRDGCARVPTQWFRRVAAASECAGLADRLTGGQSGEGASRRCCLVVAS